MAILGAEKKSRTRKQARIERHQGAAGSQSIQKRLEEELQWLKHSTGICQDVNVLWVPSADKALSGEVKAKNIIVYEPNESEALKTLRHEFIDYCLCQAIVPYKEVTNALVKLVNDDAYRRKEIVVEALTGLIGEMRQREQVRSGVLS
jgi:hypothetical protein